MSNLISVTTIIGCFLDKRWFKDKYALRGSMVHKMCEKDILDPFDMGDHTPKGFEGYYSSFVHWKEEVLQDHYAFLIEPRLVDPVRNIVGHPDLVLKHKTRPDELFLVDYKTSSSKAPWWRLQMAAYKMMIDNAENIKGTVVKYGSLRIRDGKKALYDSYEHSYYNDLNVFLEAYNTERFFKLWNFHKYLNWSSFQTTSKD